MSNKGPKRGSKGSSAGSRSTTAKGRMIEEIVARMHNRPGVRVERNVMLTPAVGTGTQKREVDVLVSTEVLGYPIQWAIECKNEAKPIESGSFLSSEMAVYWAA